MNGTARSLLRWAGLVMALAVLGCGDRGPVRYDLSGEATFDGRPIPAGLIFFDPDIARGNDGPAGFATIRNGHYDTRDHGKGMIGGPHRVRIHGFDGRPGAELPMGKMLFPEFALAVDFPKQSGTWDVNVPAHRGSKR